MFWLILVLVVIAWVVAVRRTSPFGIPVLTHTPPGYEPEPTQERKPDPDQEPRRLPRRAVAAPRAPAHEGRISNAHQPTGALVALPAMPAAPVRAVLDVQPAIAARPPLAPLP